MASKGSAVGDEEHQKWDLRDVPSHQGKDNCAGVASDSGWWR